VWVLLRPHSAEAGEQRSLPASTRVYAGVPTRTPLWAYMWPAAPDEQVGEEAQS
jgi:hypothetical protein